MIVMEAFGKALILEPYFATVVLAGGVLRHGASETQKAELIPAIAKGRTKLAFAYAEPQSRYDLFDVETQAKRDGEGWLLSGIKDLVLHGHAATRSSYRREWPGARGRRLGSAFSWSTPMRRGLRALLSDAGRSACGGDRAL